MLLVLNVPSRTVMDLMGWSQLSMTETCLPGEGALYPC